MDFKAKFTEYKGLFEEYLSQMLLRLTSPSKELEDAMRYALSGGKRLRPILFLAVFDHFYTQKHCATYINRSEKTFLQNEAALIACAIESLHAYTLIHDDLPCLDNDDFRRGEPSCHKKFGEGVALLAGDALLNLTYELLFKASILQPAIINAASEFATLCGAGGLVGGQSAEMSLENGKDLIKNDALKSKMMEIFTGKTAALFVGSAVLGGACAGCTDAQINDLRSFATGFGLAFQLKDDLSDMDTASFAELFGNQETQKLLESYAKNARNSAKKLGIPFLEGLIDFYNIT